MKIIESIKRGLVHLVFGLFWGDEGKGKAILELLALLGCEVSARYQGGPNAGHTLYVNGEKFVAHLLPSGVAVPAVEHLLIGNDVVVDPAKLVQEIREAESLGMTVLPRLEVSELAALITPYHKLLDKASEWFRVKNGNDSIGTTGSGIGPCYADAASRDALKLGMIKSPKFEKFAQDMHARHAMLLRAYIAEGMEFDAVAQLSLEKALVEWQEAIRWIQGCVAVVDMNHEVEVLLAGGKNILAEGAQGAMLDVSFGDYPFTTSSMTTAHGLFHGLGIGPSDFGKLYGVMKPYVTKVGGGAFPSRMDSKVEKYFQEEGAEFGATTGRPRMCGYLDLVVLRHVIKLHRGFGRLNIFMTKTDRFPKQVKEMFVVTGYCYPDGGTSTRLERPLSEVTGVVKERIEPWKVKSGQKYYDGRSLGLDMLVNRIRSEFSDEDVDIAYIGTGCEAGDYFPYPAQFTEE